MRFGSSLTRPVLWALRACFRLPHKPGAHLSLSPRSSPLPVWTFRVDLWRARCAQGQITSGEFLRLLHSGWPAFLKEQQKLAILRRPAWDPASRCVDPPWSEGAQAETLAQTEALRHAGADEQSDAPAAAPTAASRRPPTADDLRRERCTELARADHFARARALEDATRRFERKQSVLSATIVTYDEIELPHSPYSTPMRRPQHQRRPIL